MYSFERFLKIPSQQLDSAPLICASKSILILSFRLLIRVYSLSISSCGVFLARRRHHGVGSKDCDLFLDVIWSISTYLDFDLRFPKSDNPLMHGVLLPSHPLLTKASVKENNGRDPASSTDSEGTSASLSGSNRSGHIRQTYAQMVSKVPEYQDHVHDDGMPPYCITRASIYNWVSISEKMGVGIL